MSFYRGWNKQEVRDAGQAIAETSNIGQLASDYSISSFSPINHRPPPPYSYVDPMKTRHDRALDSDSVYDIPDDRRPEVLPLPNTKKGKSAAQGKGRAVSMGAVWSYVDEGDLPQALDGRAPPKRRKLLPSGRTKSVLPVADLSSLSFSQEELLMVTEEDTDGNDQRSQPSSLATLPLTDKRPKKKGPTPRSVVKLPAFKNPKITKLVAASISETKEPLKEGVSDVAPAPTAVISHLGWTTTQDSVRLSKTTLDKLMAYRYVPPPDTTSQPYPPATRLEHTALYSNSKMRQEEVNTPASSHGSTDYKSIHSSDLIFDVESAQQISGRLHGLDVEPASQSEGPTLCTPIISDRQSDQMRLAHTTNNIGLDDDANETIDPHHEGFARLEHMTDKFRHPQPHMDQIDDMDPFVEKAHEGNTDSPTEYNPQIEGQTLESDLQISEHFANNSTIFHFIDLKANTCTKSRTILPVASASFRNEAPAEYEYSSAERNLTMQTNETGSYITSHCYTGLVTTSPLAIPHQSGVLEHPSRPQQASTAERVDFHEVTSNDIQMDEDEFDQGLEDDDLLKIVESAPFCASAQQVATLNTTRDSYEDIPGHSKDEVSHYVSNGIEDSSWFFPSGQEGNSRQESPDIPTYDIDDEFPLDEGDEEEMLHLKTEVLETFAAPASLNYGIQEDLETMEVYDITLQFSPPKAQLRSSSPIMATKGIYHAGPGESTIRLPSDHADDMGEVEEDVDWSFIHSNAVGGTQQIVCLDSSQATRSPNKLPYASSPAHIDNSISRLTSPHLSARSTTSSESEFLTSYLDDSHEYEPLLPFVRPDFPTLVRDRSPIVGFTAHTFLRVCFRIGELIREGGRCNALGYDAVIELFARVTFSSREPGTTKQHFQFSDLFHGRPPFQSGVLANYKAAALLETESRVFLSGDDIMARCFGRLKRDSSNQRWILLIISIRETDWEEIRWTKRIVSAGIVKSEK